MQEQHGESFVFDYLEDRMILPMIVVGGLKSPISHDKFVLLNPEYYTLIENLSEYSK